MKWLSSYLKSLKERSNLISVIFHKQKFTSAAFKAAEASVAAAQEGKF